MWLSELSNEDTIVFECDQCDESFVEPAVVPPTSGVCPHCGFDKNDAEWDVEPDEEAVEYDLTEELNKHIKEYTIDEDYGSLGEDNDLFIEDK